MQQDLKITNKDWIDMTCNDDGFCILVYNMSKLVKPKDEDVDISAMLMFINTAIEISYKNVGRREYIAQVRLQNLELKNIQINLIIKTIKILQEKMKNVLYELSIYDVEDKYTFVWESIKSFIDKDLLPKIKIYTKSGKTLVGTDNII